MTHLKIFDDARGQPNLEDIEIQSPCDVPWDSLRGNERVRACGRCRENVYNISAMTRVEALRLIRANEGRVCVRIHRRPDGTVVTGDCWSRLRAARKRGLLAFVCVLLVVGCVQILAMLVGLRGLRNLVSGHQMGGLPARERPPVVSPAPPRRIEGPEMGKLPAFAHDDERIAVRMGRMPPRPAVKKQKKIVREAKWLMGAPAPLGRAGAK